MYKFATDLDQEVDSIINTLLNTNVSSGNNSNNNNNVQEKYQLPVQVGKAGQPLDAGDQPWIVGTFLPNQYVNDTHPHGHQGVDLKAPQGTPVYPIASGIVTETSETPIGGKNLKVSHESGVVVSYYAHLSQISVTKGQEVNQRTVIGLVGDTGNAKGRGAHLHYEVKVSRSNVDPLSLTGKEVGSFARQKLAQTYRLMGEILKSAVIR